MVFKRNGVDNDGFIFYTYTNSIRASQTERNEG